MSELETYLTCGRQYFHRYIEQLESRKFGGVALDVGTAVHAGMEVLYTQAASEERQREALKAALKAYDDGWKGSGKDLTTEDLEKIEGGQRVVEAIMRAIPWGKEDFKSVLSVEEEVTVDMGRDRGLKMRIDLVVEGDTGFWLHDTKTSGVDLGLVSKAHRVRKQYVGYQLGCQAKGIKLVGTMMDFIFKPRVYHKKDGTWSVGEVKWWREPVLHTNEEVEQFIRWFHTITAKIEEDGEKAGAGSHESWLQNTSRCMDYMKLCSYWDLCAVDRRSAERIKPVLYQVKEAEGWQGGVEVEV